MLEVNALTKKYGPLVAVSGVSFRVDRGETIGLLGPNGAGKTTTVSIIAGLMNADSGEVLIEGKQVKSDTDPVKLKIGLVPQDMALYDQLTARDNLTFFAALYSQAGAKAKLAIDDVLNLVALSDRAGHKVRNIQRRHEAALEPGRGIASRPADFAARRAHGRRRSTKPQRYF